MSKCEQPAPDGGEDQRGIEVEQLAKNLVHLGTDTKGHNHYWERPAERILVVDGTHEAFTLSGFHCHRLEVPRDDVIHVQERGSTDNPAAWIAFVAEEVDDRDWASEPTRIIDLSDLVEALGGSI